MSSIALDRLFSTLNSMPIYACEHMVHSEPVPPQPRVKKANKRKTRRYWKKQPKFYDVPDKQFVKIGNALYAHPAAIEDLKKAMQMANGKVWQLWR